MGQNVLSPDLVVEHVEAVSRLVLRLAIQLDLKFPYLTRCCQTHRQSPLLPSFTSTPEVRALSSAGITRLHRSYGPLRLPDWPPPFLATFGAATDQTSFAGNTFEARAADPDVGSVGVFRVERMPEAPAFRMLVLLVRKEFTMITDARPTQLTVIVPTRIARVLPTCPFEWSPAPA